MTTAQRVWTALKAQPAAARLPKKEVDRLYPRYRVRIWATLFVGYAVFYFVRKNLSAAQPMMIKELGISKTEMGLVWSALYLTYGVSKLVNGVLGDRANARYFMPIGLFFSAIANWVFGWSTGLLTLGIVWAINGWFQGMGWPAVARLLSQWFSPSERGRVFGAWNVSHQVGGGIILILSGYLTQNYGWRYSLWVPAIIALLTCFYLLNRLRDTPESLGLPPVERWREDEPEKGEVDDGAVKEGALSVREILWDHVLTNRQLWFLSLANFFVYLVRYGAMDWAPTFLVEMKHSTIAAASYKTSLFEGAGILGALVAGWLIDTKFRHRRHTVNVVYMLLLVFGILGLWKLPVGNPVLEGVYLALIGFLVYGPQMLVGVLAVDMSGKFAAATASGFTGLFGYLGGIASGIGTGWIVDRYGWDGGFVFFTASALIGTILFLFTANPATKKR